MLEPKLNDVYVTDITLRKHSEDVDQEPDSLVEAGYLWSVSPRAAESRRYSR